VTVGAGCEGRVRERGAPGALIQLIEMWFVGDLISCRNNSFDLLGSKLASLVDLWLI
jgi:hypothetical protein